MSQLTLAQKLKNLDVKFLATTEGKIFAVVPGRFGRVESMSPIKDLTIEKVKKDFPEISLTIGIAPDQQSLINAGGSARSIGVSVASGVNDINSLAELEKGYVESVFQNIKNALQTQKPGDADEFNVKGAKFGREYVQQQLDQSPNQNIFYFPGTSVSRSELEQILKGTPVSIAKIAIGNQDIPFEEAYNIIGEQVPFSQSAVEAQKQAGIEAAKTKDAKIATEQPSEFSDKATQIKQNPDGTYSVIKAKTGEVLQDGLKTVATALAVGQQISGGSTPSLSGLPEVYAQTPTQAEIDAGIQPIMGSKGQIVIPVAAVNPELALKVEQTNENLKANKEFVNGVAEAYTGQPATQEQLDSLIGKTVLEVKEAIKTTAPQNVEIKQQVEAVYGDVAKLKEEDIPKIAAEYTEKQLVEDTVTKPDILDGVDTEGLTDEQTAALEEIAAGAAQDETLLSKLGITDGDITTFLENLKTQKLASAKAEFAPYYDQLFTRASEDFTRGLEFATEERKVAMEREALKKQIALEQQAAQSAESGTAQSGIRQKAEQRLLQEAADVASSSRRRFEFDIGTAGRTAEEYLGADTLSGLKLPSLEGQAIFKPTAGVKGSLERERTTAEQTEASELARKDVLNRVASLDEAAVSAEDIIAML